MPGHISRRVSLHPVDAIFRSRLVLPLRHPSGHTQTNRPTSVTMTSSAWSSAASNSSRGLRQPFRPPPTPPEPSGDRRPSHTPAAAAAAPSLLRLPLLRGVESVEGDVAVGLPSSSAVAGCSSDRALMDSTHPPASAAAALGCCWWCRPRWWWWPRPDMTQDRTEHRLERCAELCCGEMRQLQWQLLCWACSAGWAECGSRVERGEPGAKGLRQLCADVCRRLMLFSSSPLLRSSFYVRL